MLGTVKNLWRAVSRRGAWERDLDAELRSHLEHRVADLVARGTPPETAERQARVELGSAESYKEECRSAYGLRWLDRLSQDVRYAVRTAIRNPGFTFVAITSLTLGLGANAVVFGVLDALVLRPLAIEDPERFVFVQRNGGSTSSFPNYLTLRDRNRGFSELVACRATHMGLGEPEGARRVWGYLVSGNYFEALGVQPALGRFFGPDEDREPGASPYAVLSYGTWQGRFGGDPQIVGSVIQINTHPYTVLGVAPKGFRGAELFYWPEVWVPMTMQPQIEGWSWLESRSTTNTWIYGRLRPGVSSAQAEEDLNRIAESIRSEHPQWNRNLRFDLAQPGLVGDALRAPIRAFSLGVMVLAGLVLLAACANLAILLGARTADRSREIAIRVAVGAGRGRVVRQLLTESVLLALAGGVAGWAAAVLLLGLLSQLRAPLGFPVRFDVQADVTTFAFVTALSLAATALFGIAPIRRALSTAPRDAFSGAAGGSGASRRWAARDALLVLQAAVCCVLVIASMVAIRGLAGAVETDIGFESDGVAVVGFSLTLADYRSEDERRFQHRALEAAEALPGVVSAAYASSTPLSIDQSSTTVFPDGVADPATAKGVGSSYYSISPGFLSTLRIRLLMGRDITWRDSADAPRVAIVNQAFARAVLRDGDPIGQRFYHGRGGDRVEVVGVVEDGKYVYLAETPRPAVYWPIEQVPKATTVVLARTSRPEAETARELREAMTRLDGALPLYSVGSLRQMLGFQLFPARAATAALGAFGVLAMMLVVTGVYGLAAYAVSRRKREIGIRTAIGAQPRQILQFVFGRTAAMICVGTGLGLVAGLAAGEALSSVVYHASASDVPLLVAATLTMLAAGLVSVAAPARRALELRPAAMLRQD